MNIKVEDRLQQNRMESLGILAGGVAHDFNNILTGISGYVSLAKTRVRPDSPLAQFLVRIENAAALAADLSKKMLAYSGDSSFRVQPIDVEHEIQELSPLLRAAVAKNVTMKLELGKSRHTIEADVTQIRQVVMNLIINASETVREQRGAVVVRTRTIAVDREFLQSCQWSADAQPGTFVAVAVIHDGSGMDEAMLANIFESATTTAKSGPGLAIPQ
jgi:signal transduction histidine kinase